jgi:hypothetical protein
LREWWCFLLLLLTPIMRHQVSFMSLTVATEMTRVVIAKGSLRKQFNQAEMGIR